MSQKRKEEKKQIKIVGETKPASIMPTAPRRAAISIPMTFDDWWLQVQNKYKMNPDLKTAVKRHFKARGFDDYTKFQSGLRDFGFNV